MKNQFSGLSGKELVAAGHQFAKSLDADAPLIEIAKMFSEMASRLDCAIARGDELQQKLDAVGPFIQPHDLKALLRFNETSEDGEGYDISDDAMSRLVELGLVAKERGKMRIITSFGMWVVARENGEKISALETQRDRDLAFQQRIAQLRSGTHDTADKAGEA